MKHSISNVCGRLHQWNSRAKCFLKQSHRAWIHSPNHSINTASFSGCGCLISSVALGDGSRTSRPRRFLLSLTHTSPTVERQGWLCTQTGGQLWGEDTQSMQCDWYQKHSTCWDLWRAGFPAGGRWFSSGIGRVDSSWGTGVFSLLIFHFLPHTTPLSLKCFNCFYWAEEKKRSKVGFCQSNHLVLSILIKSRLRYPHIWESSLELLLKNQPGKVIQICIMEHRLNGVHRDL